MEIFPFHPVDSFVVDGGKCIQFFLLPVEGGRSFLILQVAHLFKVGIHRVEGINGNAVVGIRVCPCMSHGGIVDR